MHIDYFYYTLLQINFIRAAHIALHTLYFREIIYLPLYLLCFFSCLQFKQKISPQPQPYPQLPATDDDDDDDEDDRSAPTSTLETAPPTASSSSTTAAAAVPSTSTAGVFTSSKKKGRTSGGDTDIVQLLLQHQERS